MTAAVDAKPSPALSYLMLEEAAEWFALLRSGAATTQDRAVWQAWLDTGVEQREAWHYIERISERFQSFQSADEQRAAVAALQSTGAAAVGRRGVLGALAIAAGAGLLGWQARGPLLRAGAPVLALLADHHTAVGEIRAIALADGTRVWLDTATALDVDYRVEQRRLRLLAGSVLIETARDPRPFVVDTPHGQLKALGTRFAARLENHSTELAVGDGAVEVSAARGTTSRIVGAERQASFTTELIGPDAPLARARLAWANGVLLAEDIPLGALLRELGRYQRGHISVAPAVAELRVLGGYPLRDPERTLAMLAEVLPITVRHVLPWWISVDARAPQTA